MEENKHGVGARISEDELAAVVRKMAKISDTKMDIAIVEAWNGLWCAKLFGPWGTMTGLGDTREEAAGDLWEKMDSAAADHVEMDKKIASAINGAEVKWS